MSKSKKKTEEITRTIDITLSAEKWKIFDKACKEWMERKKNTKK